ncbi:helix-turn-helix transcriptional regulator [Spirosoma aerolatum]|uniref:helix-turn-helix transcriptional regulator n=1 Tax=Spirosoma aerolatum TaxID=1211326 RepID=UPI0009ADD0AE|nr:WYL domain-containing protein [Spirosoma aerolatum]
MPIVKNREDRLHAINSRLNRWGNRPAPTEELARLCDVAQSTIKQDIAYLKDVHAAPIEYSRKPKGYYYTEPFNLAASITFTEKDLAALHAAVATLNQYQHLHLFDGLRGTVDKIDKAVRFRTSPSDDFGQYILFESVPFVKGSTYVELFLQAIHAQRVVTFAHQRFDTEKTKPHRLFPYVIKEHRNRWYVVGWQLDYGKIRVFGLDRIIDGTLQITDDTYNAPAFDANLYFHKALGVAAYDNPPEEVILSFTRQQGLIFRAQPFYPFQEADVLADTENEFRIKLSIIVNKELVYELARLGNSVKVLSPQTLVDDLIDFHRQALAQYP